MDYEAKQEHYKDLRRQAEKDRLVSQVMANRERSGIWQRIGRSLSDAGKGKSTRDRTPDSGQLCCAEEAA
jgi:hypothetical protein